MDSEKPTNVKVIRDKLKMTQAELASQLGVTIATVSRWENESHKISRVAKQSLIRLCQENDLKTVELSSGDAKNLSK